MKTLVLYVYMYNVLLCDTKRHTHKMVPDSLNTYTNNVNITFNAPYKVSHTLFNLRMAKKMLARKNIIEKVLSLFWLINN